ncbi:MAG: XamI family restriction endonuclease [Deferrisomatales bacterium]|nr:XamI family restriction endonuclease [Deferrisomatales bacterium]
MSQWPRGAVQWSREQIRSEVGEAWREFCGHRFQLAQQTYPEAFQEAMQGCRSLIHSLPQLLESSNGPTQIADLLRDEAQLDILCCLAAPPVTKAELAALVGAPLDAALFLDHPPLTNELRAVIAGFLDPVRFRWLRERRPARLAEEEEAILITAALTASRQTEIAYRRTERGTLASEARKGLLDARMQPRSAWKVQDLQREAPAPGEFSDDLCLVGEDEADLLVGLVDGRTLALRCVATDAEKVGAARLQEAAQAARRWGSRYGIDQLVPAVAVQGLFRAEDIEAAQAAPMVIFWAHRLDELSDFVLASRT